MHELISTQFDKDSFYVTLAGHGLSTKIYSTSYLLYIIGSNDTVTVVTLLLHVLSFRFTFKVCCIVLSSFRSITLFIVSTVCRKLSNLPTQK